MPLPPLVYFALQAVYAAVLVYVSLTDLRSRIIPNAVVLPAIGIGLVAMFFTLGWGSALLGSAVAALVMTVPVLIYGPGRAGIGDVKLALFIGLVVGYPAVVYALAICFVAAAAVALAGLVSRRLTRRSTMPFAPFLSLGAIIMLFGPAAWGMPDSF